MEDIDLIHSFTSREMTEDQSACVDSDPEALDSEEDRVEGELGIDAEESDSTCLQLTPVRHLKQNDTTFD